MARISVCVLLLAATAAALAVVTPASASTPWPQIGGSAQHVGISKNSLPTGHKVSTVWGTQVSDGIGGNLVMDSNEHLYIPTGGAHFANPGAMCMYASNGTTKWFTPLTVGSLTGNAPLTPALSADEKTVYFHAGTGFLFAVDAATGTIKWNVTTASSVRQGFYSSPTVDEAGNIYVAGHGGASFNVIQAVAPSGKTLWVSPVLGGQPATVGVDEATKRVVLGCNTDGGYGTTAWIYALDMDTGKIAWTVNSTTISGFAVFVQAPPVIFNGVAYVAVADSGYLLALDIATGKRLWQTAGASSQGAALSADHTQIIYQCAFSFGDEPTVYNLCGVHINNGSQSLATEQFEGSDGGSKPITFPATALPIVAASGQVLQSTGDSSGWGSLFEYVPTVGNFSIAPAAAFSTGLAMGTAPIIQPNGIVYVSNRFLGQIWKVQFA